MSDFVRYISGVQHGFTKTEKNGVVFFTIPSFCKSGLVKCGFSSRIGGVSAGEFSTLNFSLKREGDPEHFRENIRRFARALDVDYSKIAIVNYAHADGVYALKPADAGAGLTRENTLPKADALIVDRPGIAGMTMHADCVPVFILDQRRGIASIAHSGWRGVVKRLPQKIIEYFIREYGSHPQDLLAAIGPHMGVCCFEVGKDVGDLFEKEFGRESVVCSDEKLFADMQYGILKQFFEMSIPAQQVTVSDLCTYCREDLFYSHRRDHGKTGAMACLLEKI